MKITTHLLLTLITGGFWPFYLIAKSCIRTKRYHHRYITMEQIDYMTGDEFEILLEALFSTFGFMVYRTHSTGDYGADLIIENSKTRIAVQAKRYSSNVDVSAVQEVVATKSYYSCYEAMVVTNNYFTPAAKKLANANKVLLLDREWLINELFS